jgi:hypothetical protein
MKLHTRLMLLLALLLALPSCTSYVRIAKKEAITKDFVSHLRVNRRYKFHLATGSTMRVRVESIANDTVYGKVVQSGQVFASRKDPFSDSVESLDANVIKISRREFNPFLTILVIVVPAFVLAISGFPYDSGF